LQKLRWYLAMWSTYTMNSAGSCWDLVSLPCITTPLNQIHKLFTMYINECLLYMENVILLTWKRQFSRLEVVICAHCKAKNVHPYKSGQSSILNLSALGIDEYSEYLYFGERWVLKSLSTMGIGEYPTLSSIQFCILDWD
jgi:hypothetical protein